jgi:uncharacterized membrane protein
MRLKNHDLIIAVTIVAMNVIWALLAIHLPVIGIILALPLVFILPGYTLTEALFGRRALHASHRLLLSLGLSLAIVILSGFILNFFPVGLQAISWAIFLGILTTTFSLLVAYLRRRNPANGIQLPELRFRLHEYILFGLAITVMVLTIQYSAISLAQQPHSGFTELWLLPSAHIDNRCTVRLGVHSFESTQVTYSIAMTVNGTQVHNWSSIALAPQKEWTQVVTLAPESIDNLHVAVLLYRLDRPEVAYRKAGLTLYLSSGSKNGNLQSCETS